MNEVHNVLISNALAAQMARMHVQADPEQMHTNMIESSTDSIVLHENIDIIEEPVVTDIAESVHREAAQSLINMASNKNKVSHYIRYNLTFL